MGYVFWTIIYLFFWIPISFFLGSYLSTKSQFHEIQLQKWNQETKKKHYTHYKDIMTLNIAIINKCLNRASSISSGRPWSQVSQQHGRISWPAQRLLISWSTLLASVASGQLKQGALLKATSVCPYLLAARIYTTQLVLCCLRQANAFAKLMLLPASKLLIVLTLLMTMTSTVADDNLWLVESIPSYFKKTSSLRSAPSRRMCLPSSVTP